MRPLYLPMKRYSFCITFTPTAYATNDTTIIRHVYKPILQSAFLFAPAWSWDLLAIKLTAVYGLVFFQVNGSISEERIFPP